MDQPNKQFFPSSKSNNTSFDTIRNTSNQLGKESGSSLKRPIERVIDKAGAPDEAHKKPCRSPKEEGEWRSEDKQEGSHDEKGGELSGLHMVVDQKNQKEGIDISDRSGPAKDSAHHRNEEEYRQWLIKSQPEFQDNQQNLRTYFDEFSDFEEFQLRDKQFKHILEQFKLEVNYVAGKCLTSNFVVNDCIDEWKLTNETYKQSLNTFEKDRSSCSPEQLVDQMEQLQKATALLADFTKAKLQVVGQKPDEVLSILERVRISESGEEKQQRLQVYQQWLQRHQQKIQEFQEFQESLQKLATPSMEPIGDKVGLLSKEIGNSTKEMIAIGHLIKKDHPRSSSQEVSDLLNSLKDDIQSYDAAVKSYNGLKQENQGLPEAQRISNALKKLSSVIEETARIQQDYSKLANPDIGVQIVSPPQNKGKERAENSSTPSDDDASTKTELVFSPRYIASQSLAETLQKQEYEASTAGSENDGRSSKRFGPDSEVESKSGSESDMSVDSESSDGESMSGSDRNSSKQESVFVSDRTAISKADQERKDKLEHSLGILEVAHKKLGIYLRDSEYLSNQEIQKVIHKLHGQVVAIHKNCLKTLERNEDDKKIATKSGDIDLNFSLLERNSVYEEYGLSNQKSSTDKEKAKLIFNTILDHQKDILELARYSSKQSTSKKILNRFVKQVEQGQFFQERNIEALKAEVRARELGYGLFQKLGSRDWKHRTVAVAYMRDTKTGKMETVVSISQTDFSLKIKSLIEELMPQGERWRWANNMTGSGGKHAEHVLLDDAKDHGLKIEGLGASHNCCGSCRKRMMNNKDIKIPQALGQEWSDNFTGWHLRGKKDYTSILSKNPYDVKNVSDLESDQDETKIGSYLYQDISSDDDETYQQENIPVESSKNVKKKDHPIRLRDFPDWITEPDKGQLREAARKDIYRLLDSLGKDEQSKPIEIDVEAILPHISVFKAPDNRIFGTNNYRELSRFIKKKYQQQVQETNLIAVWKRTKGSHYLGWKVAIPEASQTVTWHWDQVYALQQKDTKRIVIYDSLRHFAGDQGLTDRELQRLQGGEEVNDWKIIKKKIKEQHIDIQVISQEQREQKNIPVYEDKIKEGKWYSFVLENKDGEIIAKACVRKNTDGAFKKFFEHIGTKGIDLDAPIKVIDAAKNIKESAAKNIKESEKYNFNGWKADKRIKHKPSKQNQPLKKTKGNQKKEPKIIVWNY